jgi:hypothetical protein
MPKSAGRRWHLRAGRTTPSLIFQIPHVYSDRVRDQPSTSTALIHSPHALSRSDAAAVDLLGRCKQQKNNEFTVMMVVFHNNH